MSARRAGQVTAAIYVIGVVLTSNFIGFTSVVPPPFSAGALEGAFGDDTPDGSAGGCTLALDADSSTTNRTPIRNEVENLLDTFPDADGNRMADALENNLLEMGDETPVVLYLGSNSSLDEDIGMIHLVGGKVLSVSHSPFEGVAARLVAQLPKSTLSYFTRHLPNLILVREAARAIPTLFHAGQQVGVNPRVWSARGLRGDPQASVAVIDGSGIDTTSPGLSGGKVLVSKDFTQDPPVPVTSDYGGHGTRVSMAAVGSGFNSTDWLGRVVTSAAEKFDGSTLSLPQANYTLNVVAFNVTKAGEIELKGRWLNGTSDSTAGVNNFSISAPNGTSFFVQTPLEDADYTLNVTVLPGDLGYYTVQANFMVWDPAKPKFNVSFEVHYPFNFSLASGYPWSGVAPDCKLVFLKALYDFQVEDAMDWILQNRQLYKITVACFSFKFSNPVPEVAAKTAQLVENGIVVVSAAGNEGPGANYAGAESAVPGSVDLGISVGATGWNDSLTSYSAEGGSSYTGLTSKPDVVAPGGEYARNQTDYLPIITADSNDGDLDNSWPDRVADDLTYAVGTSYSAPITAGGAQLVIQAMGGVSSWDFSKSQALRVKATLLMTATETWPAHRLKLTEEKYAPTLDRGGKDAFEGYGRINVDAAVDAVKNSIDSNGTFTARMVGVGDGFSTERHCWASKVVLKRGYYYNITLYSPTVSDFDLYLYDEEPDAYGDPVVFQKSTRPGLEVIDSFPHLVVNQTTTKVLVVKAVEGSGNFSLHFTGTIDTTPPDVAVINTPENGTVLGKQQPVTYDAGDGETGIWKVQVWDSTVASNPELMNESLYSPNHTIWWDTTTRASGERKIRLTVFDYNENKRNSSEVVVTVDNDPPDILELSIVPPGNHVHGIVQLACSYRDYLSGVNSVMLWIYGDTD
ncbi:MAG: S8 family serine peptidase, partial [Promethearchaeota archaeon]